MAIDPAIRYPATEVTPAGWFHIVKGNKPMMWLDAHDDSVQLDLLGGLAAPYNDPTMPEAVVIKGLKGLIPPWKHIQQKGATQDGATHIDALLDPTEVEMSVQCIGRDWKHQARVARTLVDSIDAIEQSRLNFVTHDMGHWWADIRWFQGGMTDPLNLIGSQPHSLRLQADTGCWATYDHAVMLTASGWLERFNVGDQKMYDDYTVFGPGTFRIYDGPDTDEYVEFGPLLPNQIVFLRTDPRVNTTLVQDLTVVPPTPQELTIFQDALTKFLSFAGMNEGAFGDQIKGLFGIKPPQGNLYRYLSGRFSENAAIPPKSPGNPVSPYHVKVEIIGGNVDSKIIASGTPLRRWPI